MLWVLFIYYDCNCFKIFIWIAKDIQLKMTEFLECLKLSILLQIIIFCFKNVWNHKLFSIAISCNLEIRVLHYISVGILRHKYFAHVTCLIDWKSNLIFWFVWQYDNGFEALWFLSFQFDILSARLKKMAWLTSRTASSFFVLYILKIFLLLTFEGMLFLQSLSVWQSIVFFENTADSKNWRMEIKENILDIVMYYIFRLEEYQVTF